MLTITLYGIRHKPTGHYLTKVKTRSGRGGTWREPQEATSDNPPRLFRSVFCAKIALTYWLKGMTVVRYDNDGEQYNEVHSVPSRKIEEMEIVPITLSIP